MTTMDGFVQLVVDITHKVNRIQLILLGLEGVFLCLVCVAWVWHLLQVVANFRFSMYSMFIVSDMAPSCCTCGVRAMLEDRDEETIPMCARHGKHT